MPTDLVIILSSDWVASTATRTQLGEDAADALQEVHDTLLRRVIDRAEGRVVKHSGDGVLAIFHSATAALAAAVEIQEHFAGYRASADAMAPVDIRVGLAAGDVKHQSGDIFGLPVIEAVRLQSAAQPNEILCSDLVRVLSQGRGGFEFENGGELELKGLPRRVAAWRVRRPSATASAAVRGSPAPAAASRTLARRQWRVALGALGAVAVVAAFLHFDPVGMRGGARPDSAAASSSQPTAPSPPPSSIAVIPFTNLSPNQDDAYFAVGIHEEILNQLAKLDSLDVVSRTTVRRYADTDLTIPEIARELGVGTIMEGSVRYADGRVLVTAQLIDGASDSHLWSESYEREFSNIFAIQTEIALSVARALEAELRPEERARIERAPTTSLEAYDLYLSAVARDERQTRDDILIAIEEIDRALELDPQFVLAWVRKATLSTVAPFFDPQGTAQHLANGEHAARRAIELDPLNGPAHSALGFISFQIQDWRGSERAYRRALELGEPLGEMASYAVLRLSVGDPRYARDVLEATRVVAPQNPTALGFLVAANALLGDWPSAVSQYERGSQLFQQWSGTDIMIYLRLARGELAEARALTPVNPVSEIMLARVDSPAEAQRELQSITNDAAYADPVSQRSVAVWAATLGDPQLAINSLRSATVQGGNALYMWFPQFREARRLSEFKALVRDLGIVAYWQEFGWPAACRPLGGDDFECS